MKRGCGWARSRRVISALGARDNAEQVIALTVSNALFYAVFNNY
jgi:hypothetical protein